MGYAFWKFAVAAAVLVAALAQSSPDAKAYTPTISPGGQPVRWSGRPYLKIAGNPRNISGVSEQSFFSSVVRSLQRWQSASQGEVRFDYWQGTDGATYEPNSDYNGQSSIYFASNQKGGSQLTPNVLGLTQVWYDTSSGKILETDIVLNDQDFRFTIDATDTSGYGSGSSSFSDGKSNVFIENVLTHELGHVLGLSHSGGLQSTMLFMESPEQAHLGCDELVAIHGVYPSASDAGLRGDLTGSVVSSGGTPVFGAHVLAISRRRGTVLASGLTDKNGQYRIAALEPGSYFLMVEPFFAGAQTLPGYFSSSRADVCPGNRTFSRTFYTDGSSYGLKPVTVNAGGRPAVVPAIQVACNDQGGAAVSGSSGSMSIATAPVIFDASRDPSGFGVADRFRTTDTTFYRLNGLSGTLELHVLSYSLYSPIRPMIGLLDEYGNEVSAEIANQVYSGESGFVNYDTALKAENLPSGDYVLKVSSQSLDATLYPAGPISLDIVPFLVVTGTQNADLPALSATLAMNARCRQSENFAAYVSPAGGPPRQSTSQKDGGPGGCGTIRDISKGGTSGGDGSSAAAIVSWFAPWLLMGLGAKQMSRSARRRRLAARGLA